MRIAILMLACSDYEALELSLACHGTFMPKDTHFVILQNCRGTYDAERTLATARRFQRQYPDRVTIVDSIPPGAPYRTIAALLKSEIFADIDFVCKVDDDAFPIADGWLTKLKETYISATIDGIEPAYVTPLINNNTWGFAEILEIMSLRDEYITNIAKPHFVGCGSGGDNPLRVIAKEDIFTGGHGTIWGSPHVARWIHEKTTMVPNVYIQATAGLAPKDISVADRYSIGCILFRKELWGLIDDGGDDDEHMFHQYCQTTGSRIVCARSVPFVHIAYFSQRDENRDIVPKARAVYEDYLNLPWPIAMRATRELEIEARLRWMEGQGAVAFGPAGVSTSAGTIAGMTPEQFAVRAARGLVNAIARKMRLKNRLKFR